MSAIAEADYRIQDRPKIMGSSLRRRRLVIAGYVLFDPIALARPSMRPLEIALLTSLLRRASCVVEFGAGGSTTLALKLGVKKLISVESDPVWIERILADDSAARAQEEHRLHLIHADIGAIGMFGGPQDGSDTQSWSVYPTAPWSHLEAHQPDLVVIDGRFRVACIMETILRTSDGAHPLIAIHDFWDRPAYHSVLPFLQEITRCETLGVFRVKRDFDHNAARLLLAQAQHIAA